MKKHNTILPALLFFVTGAIMTQAGLDSEVFAQETNASSNNNVSTSANTPITLAKGNKVGLQVEELSVTKSATAVTEVKGKIRNNNTVSVNDVKVNAQFFDKDSTVLSNTTKFVSSQSFILKPGDTLPFEFLEIISFDRVARYNITALGVVTG
jgi:biopolymer transport protein ExbD